MLCPSKGIRLLLSFMVGMAPKVLSDRTTLLADWESTIKWAGGKDCVPLSVAPPGVASGSPVDLLFDKDIMTTVPA